MGFVTRLAVVVGCLFLEKFLLNFFVDFAAAQAATGAGAAIRVFQHWAFRFLVTLAISLALFTYVRGRERFTAVDAAIRNTPLRPMWLGVHAILLPPIAVTSTLLYGAHAVQPFVLVVGVWLLLALAAVLALLAALAPRAVWWQAVRSAGILWLPASLVAAVAASAMEWSQRLWSGMARVTFELVRYLLVPLVPGLQANPDTHVIDTGRFAVEVTSVCSGLEGVGLMLTFCAAWLLLFRREYRFPRALVLIPAGVLLILVLNVLRIAALVLIGHAGWSHSAVYGFHSQAGWIAFNCAACLIAFASRKSPWLSKTATVAPEKTHNPVADYLLPFLALLAAGMVARSLSSSSSFEMLYVLRPIAAALALYHSWPGLTSLEWRVSWRGPLVGLVAFGCWALGAHFLTQPTAMPAQLAALSPPLRDSWLAVRAGSSVVIVPLAEELAYRGFLLRRLLSADFEAVRFQSVAPWALLVSAVVFGVGHGSLWLPGIAAGVLYGAVLIRTGSMGEAMVAHAATNGLVAIWVLVGNQWQLW
jgi:exosortase E/protease (VPEID-CTERM system)